jgi:hypothetical protein
VVVLVETHSDGTTARAHQVLRRAGALAFLDTSVHMDDDVLSWRRFHTPATARASLRDHT